MTEKNSPKKSATVTLKAPLAKQPSYKTVSKMSLSLASKTPAGKSLSKLLNSQTAKSVMKPSLDNGKDYFKVSSKPNNLSGIQEVSEIESLQIGFLKSYYGKTGSIAHSASSQDSKYVD